MKNFKLWKALLIFLPILLPAVLLAEGLTAIVTTDDLAKSLKDPNVIIVDIRKVEDYKAGHIPGAISIFYGNWAPAKGNTQNEIPEDDDLIDLLSSNGIQPDSHVVLYNTTATGPDRANVTRVAWTLKYAGVKKIAVLSGGIEKWAIREKRELSTETTKPKSKPYKAAFNKNVVATKDYLKSQIGKSIIVDAREPAFFSGQQKLPFVAKAGRIKGAVNLPTVQVFDKYPPGEHMELCCWTYKDVAALKNMATGVVGYDPTKEIIVYCDSGRVASVWSFILSEVLGYKNVRMYDGSMEEWTRDETAPVEP